MILVKLINKMAAVCISFLLISAITGCAAGNATSESIKKPTAETEKSQTVEINTGMSQTTSSASTSSSVESKIENNRKIAEGYLAAYDAKAVKDGATYADWKFAQNADYWSPYFGNATINLSKNPVSVKDSATFEALSYSIEFPDWAPVNFKCWPSENGVAWKTEFGGHKKSTGEYMSFFVYSYIDTNEKGEITHWETHVNSDYNSFLDAAIGVHGPFKNGSKEYMQAVYAKLKSAGVDLSKLKH